MTVRACQPLPLHLCDHDCETALTSAFVLVLILLYGATEVVLVVVAAILILVDIIHVSCANEVALVIHSLSWILLSLQEHADMAHSPPT